MIIVLQTYRQSKTSMKEGKLFGFLSRQIDKNGRKIGIVPDKTS